MRQNSFNKMIVAVIGLSFVLSGNVKADKMQLQERLSKEVKIQLNDVTIAEALKKIGEKAGLPIVLSDEAVWRLPYGEATRLSVALNGPLTDSLTEMLNEFFMRYAVDDEKVTIYPRPELDHILGRASAKQLELLKDIYTKSIKIYIFGSPQRTINKAIGKELMVLPISIQQDLVKSLDALLGKEIKMVEHIEQPGQHGRSRLVIDPNEIGKENELPTPITLAQLFDNVASNKTRYDERARLELPDKLAWYLAGMDFTSKVPEVRFVAIKEFKQAKLDQIIDISYKDKKVGDIIQSLGKLAGLELNLSSYANAPWLDEKISVDMQNIKLIQALRNVIGSVGGQIGRVGENDTGAYQIEAWGPQPKEADKNITVATPRRKPVVTATASEAYVGKISIPMDGGKYFIEFMLRESDLNDQLKKLRDEKMKEILGEPAKQPSGPRATEPNTEK